MSEGNDKSGFVLRDVDKANKFDGNKAIQSISKLSSSEKINYGTYAGFAILGLLGAFGAGWAENLFTVFSLLTLSFMCAVNDGNFILEDFIDGDKIIKSYQQHEHLPVWQDRIGYGILFSISIGAGWFFIAIVIFATAVFDEQIRNTAERRNNIME